MGWFHGARHIFARAACAPSRAATASATAAAGSRSRRETGRASAAAGASGWRPHGRRGSPPSIPQALPRGRLRALADHEPRPADRAARSGSTAASWRTTSTSGRGLYFFGEIGSGKTSLAMCVAKEVLRERRSLAIFSGPRPARPHRRDLRGPLAGHLPGPAGPARQRGLPGAGGPGRGEAERVAPGAALRRGQQALRGPAPDAGHGGRGELRRRSASTSGTAPALVFSRCASRCPSSTEITVSGPRRLRTFGWPASAAVVGRAARPGRRACAGADRRDRLVGTGHRRALLRQAHARGAEGFQLRRVPRLPRAHPARAAGALRPADRQAVRAVLHPHRVGAHPQARRPGAT